MKHLRHLLRALCALPLAWLPLQPAALAQPGNTAGLEQAVLHLSQFQQEVGRMREVVHQPLGPYRLETQCTWCSSSFLGICLQNTTERWGANVDFSWTRQRIDAVLARAERDAGNLEQRYAPTRAWIAGLPAFSTAFGSTADIVLGVQQEIKQGNGPTAEQRQRVTQALQKLHADLSASADQLQAGISTLAQALEQQSAYRSQISEAIQGSDQDAKTALEQVRKASQNHRCQDGLPERFAEIQANFNRSTQQVSSAFQNLNARSGEAEKSLAALLGAVVSARTQMQSVMDLVQATSNDQLGGFLERLHLASAKKQWEDLAAAQATARLASR